MVDAYLPPLPDDEPEVTTFMDKISAAVRRGVVGFFRQSSDGQRIRNTGSQRAQEEHLEQLRPFGVTREHVRVILAYGESAREGMVRRKFQELKAEISSGRVGLVLLARHDRLSRNTPDAAELFALLVENEVLLMVDGRVYDPSNEGDSLILGLYAQFAEYENRVRSRWMAVTRLAKARNLELRIRMPSGLVWADPEDREYRAKLKEARLSDWLQGPMGKPCSEIDGRKYYVLPYPDEEVATALRLLREWVLETRSMHEVEKRIRAGHGGWPHPGKMPAACQARPYPKATVTWSPMSTGSLYNYLHSPALFGRYRYDASALKRKKPKIARGVDAVAAPSVKPKLDRRAADVDVPDAFRSWFAPEEERVVRRVLSGGGRNFCQKNQENPTDSLYHAVGTLRCGMEVAPGRRCGRKMMAYMLPSGSDSRILRYKSGGCRQTRMPHYVEVSGALDWQVLQILIDVFRPDALKDMAADLSVQRNSSREEGRALAVQLARAERERDSAETLAVEAKAEELAAKRAHDEAPSEESRREFEDKQEAVKRWTERASLAGRKIRELKESRARQGRQLEAYEEVTDEELQRCVELAVDLPGLIERVRGVPGALQRIVECLTSEVWLKKLGSGVYEVTVEFPSGESVARIFLDHTRCVPQPTRVLAAGRLAAGVEPADIAAELARHPAPTGRMTCALDEEDVVGVALMHRYFETEAAREGEHASVEDLAARTGESHERVAAVILAGELGPARWNHGMLVVRPSEAELHRALPEFALREVARVNGIAPAALVSSSVLYRANRSLPAWRIELPLKECALYQDAHRKRYFLREEVERTGLSMRVNEKEAEEARAALAAAVTALGRSELRPEDFHPCVTVVRQLGPRFGDVSPARIKRAVRRGKVPAVRCLGIADTGRLYPNLLFVHVPPPVMSATSVDVVLGWMAGQEGERPPRPGRRRKPDIQLHTELQA